MANKPNKLLEAFIKKYGTTVIFVAQYVAFLLMVIGFLIFIWLWYKGAV